MRQRQSSLTIYTLVRVMSNGGASRGVGGGCGGPPRG
jgi:hypothetical protein